MAQNSSQALAQVQNERTQLKTLASIATSSVRWEDKGEDARGEVMPQLTVLAYLGKGPRKQGD